jgi:pimeloyl-[acyl-carrier protein] methyl ester esterase
LFRPVLRALDAELQPTVIAYPSDETLDLAELGGLVLRQLPPGKTVLVAESCSGLVALSLLASSSARIAGVVFVGAFAEPPRPLLLRLAPLVSRSPALMRSAPSFLLRQYCLGKTASADDLKMLRDALSAVSPAVMTQRLGLVGTRHSFGKAKFDVPCYYLRATEDRLVPASCADWFRQRFQRCEVVDIGGPHFLLQAAPEQCADVIARAVRLMVPAG